MNRAMFAAASGMAAQQTNLEIIADNLANADVTGFKSAAASFADVDAGGIGLGTAALGRHPVFGQGKLVKSGGPFDCAIDGAGFFAVEKNGARAYTRAGDFARTADGHLANGDGWRLRGVKLPPDALTATVDKDGRIFVDTTTKRHVAAGRIELATFPSPESLRAIDGTRFAESPASGPPHMFAPGGDGRPSIAFGMLEKANVSIVESMMSIMSAQRAYEANAKGVQAADEMLRIANNLHRG